MFGRLAHCNPNLGSLKNGHVLWRKKNYEILCVTDFPIGTLSDRPSVRTSKEMCRHRHGQGKGDRVYKGLAAVLFVKEEMLRRRVIFWIST